jgi:hypothetical protein
MFLLLLAAGTFIAWPLATISLQDEDDMMFEISDPMLEMRFDVD